MIPEIRPVTDLRYNFSEIENAVKNGPVYLTKNGRGLLVVMSVEFYSRLLDDTDSLLREADEEANHSSVRLQCDEVVRRMRERLDKK